MPALRRDPPQRVSELFGLVHVEPRRRLVEQHHRRVRRERPSDLEESAGAERDRERRSVGDGFESEQVEDARRPPRPRPARALAEAGEVADHAEEALTAFLDARATHEVLAHGELGEELHALERAGEAAWARCWGLRPVTSVPFIVTRPAFGRRRPDRTPNSVVFPAPLGPTRPTVEPSGTARLT